MRTLIKIRMRVNASEVSPFVAGLNISKSFGFDINIDNGEVTFAVLSLEREVKEMLDGLKLNRDLHVVMSKDTPIYFLYTPIGIRRGVWYSLISAGIGQLAQSGLFEFWGHLHAANEFLQELKKISVQDRSIYRKMVTIELFRVRKEIVFDEQVSMSALGEVVALCGGVICAAIVGFMWEWLSYEVVRSIGRKCRQAVNRLVIGMKLLVVFFKKLVAAVEQTITTLKLLMFYQLCECYSKYF